VTAVARTTATALLTAVGLLAAGCAGSASAPVAATSGSAATSPAAPSPVSTTSVPQSPAATASSGSVATGATRPPGAKVVVDEKIGYQIAVPSGYTRVKNKKDLDRVLKAGAAAVADKGLSQQFLSKSLKMLAVDPDNGNAINVVVVGAGNATVDQLPQLESVIKDQATKIGAKKVTFRDDVTLGGQPALRGSYVLKLQGKNIPTIQYITIHDGDAFTLTFSQPAKASKKVESQTVGSWRFR
jgi:glucose/arabinose dehydrogenase